MPHRLLAPLFALTRLFAVLLALLAAGLAPGAAPVLSQKPVFDVASLPDQPLALAAERHGEFLPRPARGEPPADGPHHLVPTLRSESSSRVPELWPADVRRLRLERGAAAFGARAPPVTAIA